MGREGECRGGKSKGGREDEGRAGEEKGGVGDGREGRKGTPVCIFKFL